MNKLSVACILLLLTSASLNLALAQAESILPTDTFAIPALNSQVRFESEVNYTSANLQGNMWYFTGLSASGYAGHPIRGYLHISAQNCTVSIRYLQAWAQPEIGSVGLQWIKYAVNGSGTQTLDANDLFPSCDKWIQWTLIINGERKSVSWNLTESKLLTINTPEPLSTVEISVYHVSVNSDSAPLPPPEPALHNFSSTDNFTIPASNGIINFAVPGSFDQASLETDVWNFANLTLSTYAINAGVFAPNVTGRDVLPYILQRGYPANLGVSAQECNLTITGVTPLTWHSHEPGIHYTVQGIGSQIFTFPFKLAKFNWTITIDGVQKQNGDGWFIIDDHQLKIVNATHQVEIDAVVLPSYHIPVVPFSFYLPVIISIIIIGIALAVGSAALILHRRKRKQL